MKSIPNVLFLEFFDRIKKELDSEQKRCTEDEYEEIVGKQCKLFRDVRFGKGTPGVDAELSKWISEIKEAVGEEIWETVKNLSSSKLDDIEDCKAATIHAIVIHYRLHGELELPGIAKEIDKKVFNKKSAKLVFKRSVFEAVNYDEVPLPPTWSDRDFLNEAYQSERSEFKELKSILCPEEEASIPSNIAIYGSGGYGKSSLALEVCNDWKVQEQFPGGIYWLQFGLTDSRDEKAGHITLQQAIMNMIAEQYGKNDRSEIVLENRDEDIQALRKILPRQKLLIIADDIWTITQANWLSKYLEDAVVLITTRIEHIAKQTCKIVPIQKLPDEASFLLLTDGMNNLSKGQEVQLRQLSKHFHGWPLLLNLANGIFKRIDTNTNEAIDSAINKYEKFLKRDRIESWDIEWLGEEEIEKRRKLVGNCIEASLNFIAPSMNPELVRQLGVFPNGTEIPISVVIDLWMRGKTHGLDSEELEERIEHFREFSLFQPIDAENKSIKLHDEILDYLRSWNKKENGLRVLHIQLLESFRTLCPDSWHDLPKEHQYGWKYLLHHMEQADQIEQANELRTDFHWIKAKLKATNTSSLQHDFRSPNLTNVASKVGKAINLSSSALRKDPNYLALQLYGRLAHKSEHSFDALITAAKADKKFWPVPVRPHLDPLEHKLLTLNHDSWVETAMFSHDGRQIVTCSNDGTARVWNTLTGEQINTKQITHDAGVGSTMFNHDSTQIVTASNDGTACVWDTLTGEQINTKQITHDGAVTSAMFNHDSTQILTASLDGTACIWDAKTGVQISHAPMQHNGWVTSAIFSNDSSRIVTASYDGTACIWDVNTGRQLNLHPMHHDSEVTCATFNHDGNRIATGSHKGTICLWDANTGKQIEHQPMQHDEWVTSVTFNCDGSKILTSSSDGTAYIWNANTGKQIASQHMQHDDWIRNAMFSSDGSRVVTASNDGTACVWNTDTPKPNNHNSMQHSDWITSIVFNRDGSQVVTSSFDGTACLWTVKKGELINANQMRHEDWINSAIFNRDGSRVVTASNDGTACVWSTETGQQINTEPMKHESWVTGATFNRDGRRIVSSSNDGTVRLWSTETGEQIKVIHVGYNEWGMTPIFNHNGSRILTTSKDGNAFIWNIETGQQINTHHIKHDSEITGGIFNHDGSLVVTTSHDGMACIWDAQTGEKMNIHPMHHDATIRCVTFNRNGNQIITGADDGTICIWNAPTGEKMNIEQMKHDSLVANAVFNKDGNLIVTESVDRTVRVWNAENSSLTSRIDFDSNPVALNIHSNFMIVGTASGAVHMFQL